MAQIVGCLEGMGDACRALDYPIVSGNVSLYNESKATGGGSAILPTPAIGGVGVLEDVSKMATIGFKKRGQTIWLVGSTTLGRHLGQSLWLREIAGLEAGGSPLVDLAHEKATGEFIRTLVMNGSATAVHDISDGGMMVAVAEMALAGGMGAEVSLDLADPTETSLAAAHFGEDTGRYLVTTDGDVPLREMAKQAETFATVIGTTGFHSEQDDSEGILCQVSNGFASLADLRAAHESFFKNWMEA